MRIALLNPNISKPLSEIILDEAMRAKQPETVLQIRTADFGVEYIETLVEATIAGHAALEMLSSVHPDADAIVLAAFGDPGLDALKQASPIPVIGLTEAAVTVAHALGGRYAVVGISERIGYWYRDVIEAMDPSPRYLGYSGLGERFRSVSTVREEQLDQLLAMCHRAVTDLGADCIILAGAPLAGLAREIVSEIPVPLIDGVRSAVRMAEFMAGMGPLVRRVGAFAPQPEKSHSGLSGTVSQMIGRLREVG
jgi:allantoin racemase